MTQPDPVRDEAAITIRTTRGRKVYEYLLAESAEVILKTPSGPIKVALTSEGVAVRGEFSLTIQPDASNSIVVSAVAP